MINCIFIYQLQTIQNGIKTILLPTALGNIKLLVINVAKDVEGLYTENCNTLLKEFKNT